MGGTIHGLHLLHPTEIYPVRIRYQGLRERSKKQPEEPIPIDQQVLPANLQCEEVFDAYLGVHDLLLPDPDLPKEPDQLGFPHNYQHPFLHPIV